MKVLESDILEPRYTWTSFSSLISFMKLSLHGVLATEDTKLSNTLSLSLKLSNRMERNTVLRL
jgi:hypothetical protein